MLLTYFVRHTLMGAWRLNGGLAAGSPGQQGQQFHVESPHLQSQQQTLSAASRAGQA